MLMTHYTHKKLLDVLNKAYPDTCSRYNKFYVEFIFKEKKSGYSKYLFQGKKIKVTTLSRKPSDIFISLLVSLAKHIDIINRSETHEDKDYHDIVKHLVDTALKYKVIILQELYSCSDEKLKNMLQGNYGSFKSWLVKPQPMNDDIYILVFDAFMIKTLLRTHGYLFDADQQAWTKYIKTENFEEELYIIDSFRNRADFKIINDGSFFIRPSYCLKVETYAHEDKELWKAFSFCWDGPSRRWYKYIYAQDLYVELEMIQELPKQKVTISRIKKRI